MKNLFLISLMISCTLFSQNNDNACDYISNLLKEKPLECIDKAKLKNDEEIYQFFKWSAFKQDYLIRVEKIGNIKTLVIKKIYKSSYDEKNGKYIPNKFEILKERKLTDSEFNTFKALLDESNFWQKYNYHIDTLCSDGGGILVYALRKDYFLSMSNGNCSPSNEYLYYIYQQISKIFKL